MALPTITNNSPVAGSIAWTATGITYGSTNYSIPAGSSSKKFVWWEYRNGAPALVDGDTMPDLAPEDCLLFLNKGGVGALVPTLDVVDGSLIVSGSILAGAIAADQIQTFHLAASAVTANELSAGAVVADKLAAGAVTTDKLSVGSIGDSLVTNGSFEEFTNGIPTGWEQETATSGSIAVVSGVSSQGKYAARLAATSTSSVVSMRQVSTRLIPVSATMGRKWYVAARVGAGTAITKGFYLRVYWYDANRVLLTSGGTTDVKADQPVGTSWAILEGQATPPAAARYMGVCVRLASPNVATNVYVDEVVAREVVVAALIGDGEISTPHLKADAIDGMVVTGATVRTAATGARIVLDETGLNGWDADNINYLKADASGLSVTGTLTAHGTGYDYEAQTGFTPPPIPMDMVVGGAAGGIGLIQTEQWPPPSPAKDGAPIPGLAIKPADVDMYAFAQLVSRDGLDMQISSGIRQSKVDGVLQGSGDSTDVAYPTYLTVSPEYVSASRPIRAPKYYVNGMDLSGGEVQVWDVSGTIANATVPVPRVSMPFPNVALSTASGMANPSETDPGTLTVVKDGMYDITFSYGQSGGTTDDRNFIEIKLDGDNRLLARASFSRMEDSVVCTVTGVKLAAGAKLIFEVYQTSGGSKSYTGRIRMSRVAAPVPTAAWEQGNKSVTGNLTVGGSLTVGGQTLMTKHAEYTTTNFNVAGGGASWDTGPAVMDLSKTTHTTFTEPGGLSGSVVFKEAGYYSISVMMIPNGSPGLGWARLNHSVNGENLVQAGNDNHIWETYLSIPAVYMPADSWVRTQLSYATGHTLNTRWRIHKLPF